MVVRAQLCAVAFTCTCGKTVTSCKKAVSFVQTQGPALVKSFLHFVKFMPFTAVDSYPLKCDTVIHNLPQIY